MTHQAKIGPGTLFYEAQKHSPQGNGRSADTQYDEIGDDESNDAPPPFSDEALTRRFVAEKAERLRFTAQWGTWHIFDGTVWREDETQAVIAEVREFCGRVAAEARRSNDAKTARHAERIASKRAMDAIVSLARADRKLAATTGQWDADPWLLNTPGGVVDLRTGKTESPKPDQYMTKITAAAPGGKCPLWLDFLNKITAGDQELQAYLQRVAGYCLTGSTREQVFFFGYGTGGNGKGVFLNSLAKAMGSYAGTAAMDTFTATNSEKHPTELAKLDGLRLAITTETEQGKRWAEAKLKTFTGGDPITARKVKQDFYEYELQAKLFFTGNHRPEIANVDTAMERRLNLIHFPAQIPKAEQDGHLPEKLKAEYGGILKWMIDGCLAWQEQRLSPPRAVTLATSEYLVEEDTVGQWLSERCEVGEHFICGTSKLFQSFCEWAGSAGEAGRKQKWLTQQLKTRGFKEEKLPVTRTSGLRGLRLIEQAAPDPDF